MQQAKGYDFIIITSQTCRERIYAFPTLPTEPVPTKVEGDKAI